MAIVNAIKRWTPPSLYPLGRTIRHRAMAPLECWVTDLADTLLQRTYNGRRLPPARLRFKVRGSPSGAAFAAIGKACADDIETALQTYGRSVTTSRSILDFGCGCGGTLIWMQDLAPEAAIHGTDVDETAIDWCRKNLAFADFGANGPVPPLPYPTATFDLVYAVSVFTHLNEDYQNLWLAELQRIIAPGGTCLITLHGPDSWSHMSADARATLARDGFVFVRTHATARLFPDWYQTAFHSRRYIETTFSRYFDVVGFIAQGLANHQDIVVLERRRADE